MNIIRKNRFGSARGRQWLLFLGIILAVIGSKLKTQYEELNKSQPSALRSITQSSIDLDDKVWLQNIDSIQSYYRAKRMDRTK